MDERTRRIGENEILFREVNVQMRSLDRKLTAVADVEYPFLCECGHIDCEERIPLSVDEYARIHEAGDRFVVVPGHEELDVETVVERHSGYFVIEKDEGGPGELARRNARDVS